MQRANLSFLQLSDSYRVKLKTRVQDAESKPKLPSTIRLLGEIRQLKTRVRGIERKIKLPPMDFVMTDFQGHYDLEDQWFSEPFYTLEEGYLSVFAYGTALDEAFTPFSYSFSGQAWEGEVRKGREGRKGRSS